MFLTGLFSGILRGMGMGGGNILIPIIVLFFDVTQHDAQAINLIVYIPAVILALYFHFKNKLIDKSHILYIMFAGILGSILGSFISINTPSEVLKKVFGIFLIICGLYSIIKIIKNK